MKEEKVVQIKQCKLCNFSFKITDKDLEFYDKISPVFSSPDSTESGLKKFQIPTPTLCPDCRQQRRLSWRNERKLYRRKSDITGKDVVSIYSPDKKCRIYESSYWWGDKWNALDY
jgi:Zn ribbon nucleic-acid-binding protein